jgi:hypothetical protein
MHLHIKVYIYANAFMKRARAIKVVLSCTGSAGNPPPKKKEKKEAIPISFQKTGISTLAVP